MQQGEYRASARIYQQVKPRLGNRKVLIMKKKLVNLIIAIMILTILGTGILFSTEAKRSEVGYIIGVSDDDIWLVQGSPEEIHGKSPEELSQTFMTKGTFYETTYVPRFIKNKLKVGQKVRVYSDGTVMESAPSQDEATLLFILEE